MFQTDQATAAIALPTPAAAGAPGYFTNGNPASGVAATILDADFLNMVMMELSNVVTGAGIALSKTTYTQVLSAIKRIGQNTVLLADTGAANTYAAVNSTPLVAATWVDGVVQQVKIAHANTGASTYAPDGLTAIPIYGLGLQPLQGGELFLGGTAVLMHATIAGVNSGNPICVLLECSGGAQQIAPATQSQHALQKQQKGIQTFTSSGTFAVPAGVTQIFVSGCAGGGGGSSGASTAGHTSLVGGGGGGGGGAGQQLIRQSYSVTPGASIAITIGAAGGGGTAPAAGDYNGNAGTAGGNTVISGSGFNGGTAVTLTGGSAGASGNYAASNAVGSGGAGGGGGFGYPSGSCGIDSNYTGNGGAGASSPFGGGGGGGRAASGSAAVGGYPAGGFGGGGGGGGGAYGVSAQAAGSGGAGTLGFFLIEW